jgi:hypothetical protein
VLATAAANACVQTRQLVIRQHRKAMLVAQAVNADSAAAPKPQRSLENLELSIGAVPPRRQTG